MPAVALATRNTEFYAGRVFDPGAIAAMRPSLQPMAWPWLRVSELARERDLRLQTADLVDDPRGALLIAYDWTPDAARLVANGARPGALVSFEPPVIAWSLYADLPRLSRQFPHVFLFEGARPRVASTFHPLSFPIQRPASSPSPVPWQERRFVTMINSNKALPRATDIRRWVDRPREVSLKRLVAGWRYRPIAHDRYRARLSAIVDFPDLDLFGEGWTERHPAIGAAEHARARAAYRGPVADKLATLGRYRFALAIENSRFPGYISEKLFDCFFAGTVPVYDGAPDVAHYVPAEAFVDVRQFGDYSAVCRFLLDMPEQRWRTCVAAGQAFLESAAFDRFCADTFARQLLDALNAVS